jgi:hypothetical protein
VPTTIWNSFKFKPPPPSTLPLSLNTLPPELQLEILDHLHYPAMAKLRCVSRYWANTIKDVSLAKRRPAYRQLLFADELQQKEEMEEKKRRWQRTTNPLLQKDITPIIPTMRKGRFVFRCYDCLQFRGAEDFSNGQLGRTRDSPAASLNAIKRFCIPCGIKHNWPPGRILMDFVFLNKEFKIVAGRVYTICVSCRMLKEFSPLGMWKKLCDSCWEDQVDEGTVRV